jgi:hypothetical protein
MVLLASFYRSQHRQHSKALIYYHLQPHKKPVTMHSLSITDFQNILSHTPVARRLKSDLRFTTSTSHLSDEDWANTEILAVTDRSGSHGVLVLQPYDTTYAVTYSISRLTNPQTGRSQAIICDFCRTWQSGHNSARISLTPNYRDGRTFSLLCCGDLACSQHVRTRIAAAQISRAQLREDLSDEQRIARLQSNLQKLVDDRAILPAQPTAS